MEAKIRSEFRSNGTKMKKICPASAEMSACEIEKNKVTAAKQTASAQQLRCSARLYKSRTHSFVMLNNRHLQINVTSKNCSFCLGIFCSQMNYIAVQRSENTFYLKIPRLVQTNSDILVLKIILVLDLFSFFIII